MSVEVILKEHVENLGQRGEIVKVASGYARNYLFPRQLALAVTSENKKQVERERVKAEAREELKGARSLAATLEGLDIAIARRVGENDTLYGSVTTGDIADALAARDVTVDRRKIQLSDPLKSLGEHAVPVKLHREVTANLKVRIVAAT